MQEQNKITLSYNLLVLSAALWLFAAIFAVFSQVFSLIVNLFSLNYFFKSISEIISIVLLAVIVFGAFTGCFMFTDWLISKFWPQFNFQKQKYSAFFASSTLLISVVCIYFILAWLLVILENQI